MTLGGSALAHGAGNVLAHGVGSREDLPIPFSFALLGSAVALVVSFLALLVLWREPRLDPVGAGRVLPAGVDRALDSRLTRGALRAIGLLASSYVVLALAFGKDDALNPTAATIYVLFWVGVPLLSLLVGPVWRLVNPIRTLQLLLARLVRAEPESGLAPLPGWLGYWPAALSLLSFVWLELVPRDTNTTLPTLRIYVACYVAAHLLAGTYFGSRWFDRGDGFEVFSSLLARLSVLGRRGDGRLVLRNPLDGVAGITKAPGLFGIVGVLLGSTVFDSLSGHLAWVDFVQTGPFSPRIASTLGLVVTVALVTAAFTGASALTGLGAGRRPADMTAEFAHAIVPIVAGYFIAHYWSLLVVVGQQAVIQLSDPLGNGANWLGTAGRGVDQTLAGATTTAVIQVGAVVVGHIVGVVLAHDRAVALLPRRHALLGQLPLLVLMVGYTVLGLLLLFAA